MIFMHSPGLLSYLKSHFVTIGLLLIVGFYIINGICYLRSQSITSDEGSFYNYAIRFLKGKPERTIPASDNSKMPVIALNTIPRVAEGIFSPGTKKNDGGISDIMHGRYVTLIVSIFTILFVFAWSRDMYGNKAGLFSAFLMSLCPNNLANAALVTTDSYSVLFLLSSMYFLWKYCREKTMRYFIFFTVAVALSQLVKQSLFHLYILSPVCVLVYFMVEREKLQYGLVFGRVLIFLLINWFIINLAWYFHHSFWSIGDYHFMSQSFLRLQHIFPSSMPLPFPKPFIDGLDMAKYYDQLGGGFDPASSFGNVTILGHSKTGGGYWYYYFVSVFYKTPIAYLALLVWNVVILIRARSLTEFMGKEFFLWAPVLYFLITLSFFYQTQSGLRHIIFIYPFIFILAGIIVPTVNNVYKKMLLAVISLALLLSVLRYWENYFPYTNEFIMDKKMAFRFVGSANLDFKQGGMFLQRYLNSHPGVQYAPGNPQRGIFVISVPDFLDIWNRHKYDWIQKFKPSDHVAYTYLLFEIEGKDLEQ